MLLEPKVETKEKAPTTIASLEVNKGEVYIEKDSNI